MAIRQTDRGFDIYDEFIDSYGSQITVQESSLVAPRVWVFVDSTLYIKEKGTASMHLDMDDVDRLIAALQAWKRTQEVEGVKA